ncbi:MAG TPA: MucR family transcriptional regulator [Candidatus Synoicihabitans sp.]|nr:MucR family transcriptional regulator [Candidatus Synoicihabitans sp.]
MDAVDHDELVQLTADIVSAYVSNNKIGATELGKLIEEVHVALQRAPNAQAEPEPEPRQPAVPIRRSVTPDYIVSLEDGRKFKSLKRHLKNTYNMSPDEYRTKWGLPRDYPMVAPNYAKARSELAKTMGLGRKAAAPAADAGPKRGRRPRAAKG